MKVRGRLGREMCGMSFLSLSTQERARAREERGSKSFNSLSSFGVHRKFQWFSKLSSVLPSSRTRSHTVSRKKCLGDRHVSRFIVPLVFRLHRERYDAGEAGVLGNDISSRLLCFRPPSLSIS